MTPFLLRDFSIPCATHWQENTSKPLFLNAENINTQIPMNLLISERVDGIEGCGAARGVPSEEHADKA